MPRSRTRDTDDADLAGLNDADRAELVDDEFGAGAIKRARPAEPVDWSAWYEWFASEWKQGEHISIIGPTGTGKTTLQTELLRIRQFVVFVSTKRADENIDRLESQGYTRVAAWPRFPPGDVERYLLWPKGAGGMGRASMAQQRAVVHDALQRIYEGPRGGKPGRWCVCIDEARYVADPAYLGLRADVNQILIQGRSVFVSLVLGFQRPSWVPQEAYDQPSHLFIAGDNDRRNIQRFREIGGVDGARLAATVRSLRLYEWAHVDARAGHGDIHVVRVPAELAKRGAVSRRPRVTARDLQPSVTDHQ